MIISNNAMYKNMQQPMHNEHNVADNKNENIETKHNEQKTEHTKMEHYETTNISAQSMTDIAKMVASMLETTEPYNTNHDIKCIYEKLHDLDKRLAVTEALILHINK